MHGGVAGRFGDHTLLPCSKGGGSSSGTGAVSALGLSCLGRNL
jgi:hypothetical protein